MFVQIVFGQSGTKHVRSGTTLLLLPALFPLAAAAQQAPPSPDKAWSVAPSPDMRSGELLPTARPSLDPAHTYSLAELVDLAEKNNPETRVLWERAKEKAAAAGIARSALFPTLAAMASASLNQYSLFFGKFYHENTAVFPALLNLSWTIFDFGARRAAIDETRANLLAADFSFNDTHRQIIFRVTEAYYRLLDAIGQEDAAQAALTDAQTVQEASEAKLANGLATLPDVLEARAATAQARYELASVRGLETTARGSLATVLGASPTGTFHVADVLRAPLPEVIDEPIDTVVARAIGQRPDLQAQLALIRSAEAQVAKARSAFYPQVSFSGDWGHSNSFGEQRGFGSSAESRIYPYQAQLNVTWILFDGRVRRNALSQASAASREARAQAALSRDEIENRIWTAWSNLKTAQARQEAAKALLEAAQQSYSLATEAFRSGVRTFVDVTTAQRELARARTAQTTSRIDLLSSIADFAFEAGDPVQAAQH